MGQRAERIGPGLFVPTGTMVLLGLGLTVFAGPIYGISERAAGDLVNRHSYLTAVSDAADAMAENYPEPKGGDH